MSDSLRVAVAGDDVATVGADEPGVAAGGEREHPFAYVRARAEGLVEQLRGEDRDLVVLLGDAQEVPRRGLGTRLAGRPAFGALDVGHLVAPRAGGPNRARMRSSAASTSPPVASAMPTRNARTTVIAVNVSPCLQWSSDSSNQRAEAR